MTKAVVSLPMYDWPEIRHVVDRLWAGVASRLVDAGIDAPERLDRREDYDAVWREPGLLLSQTCGYPYIKHLRGTAALVGAPVYDVPGCAGPTYRSMIIVRRDDPASSIAALRGRRAIINDWDSQSGFSALRATVAPYAGGARFFSEVLVSGDHRNSLRLVADGVADVAAIDAVCWALAERHDPAPVAKLRVLTLSPQAPSLPFITASSADRKLREALLDALRREIDDGQPLYRIATFLMGVEAVEDSDYDRIGLIERRAMDLGYRTVA